MSLGTTPNHATPMGDHLLCTTDEVAKRRARGGDATRKSGECIDWEGGKSNEKRSERFCEKNLARACCCLGGLQGPILSYLFFVDPHGVAETISKVQRVRAPRANANGLSKLELQSLSPTYIARATESNTLAALHQRTQLGANGVATHRCSQPRKPAHTQRTLPNL